MQFGGLIGVLNMWTLTISFTVGTAVNSVNDSIKVG